MTKKDEGLVKIAPYKLVADFWNNVQVIPKGNVVSFPVGKAPRGSILLTASEAKALQGKTVEAALDPVQAELEMLRERLAKLETGGEEVEGDVKIVEPATILEKVKPTK